MLFPGPDAATEIAAPVVRWLAATGRIVLGRAPDVPVTLGTVF